MDSDLLMTGETVDKILDTRLKVIQKKKGYRFSLDSLLLAHFVHLKKDDKPLEFGAGSAVVTLILQHRFGCKKIVGIELQKDLAEMASRSVRLNGMEERIEILDADIRELRRLFPPGSFSVVFFNPPYRRIRSGRINPDSQKALARHELAGSIAEFAAAASYILKFKGHIFCIYPVRRLVELISKMRINGMEPKKLRIVHTNRHARGEFVLMEAVKGGGEELQILPPLFIYDENFNYTDDMEVLFKDLSVAHPSYGG